MNSLEKLTLKRPSNIYECHECVTGYHTVRINGHVGKKTIHILIDSGSTHNFLNVNLDKRLGCKMESIAV